MTFGIIFLHKRFTGVIMNIADIKFYPRAKVQEIKSQIYLSDDENEILELLLVDKSPIQIANRLCISVRSFYRKKSKVEKKLNNLKSVP